MRTFSALFLLTLLFSIHSNAQETPSAEQLVQAAHQLADLSQNASYVLTATVVVNPGAAGKETSGHLTIYRDHDRSRAELAMPGYSEVRVTVADKEYVSKGQFLLFTTGLENFDRSWDPLYRNGIMSATKKTYGKLSKEKRDGLPVWCFEEKEKRSPDDEGSKIKLCTDSLRKVLVQRSADRRNTTDFLDYDSAGEHMYPHRVKIRKELIADLELKDVTIKFAPIDATLFAIPQASIETARCKDLESPTRTDESPVPPIVRQGGVVGLYLLIGSDGKVMAARNMGPSSEVAKSIETAAYSRTYKPATCNGRPVVSELEVKIEYSSW